MPFQILYIREFEFLKQMVAENEPAIAMTVHLPFGKLRLNSVFTVKDGYE